MAKPDGERLGERLLVPRDGKDPVEVNLYIPEGAVALPVVFNIHGGAFIAGDDDTLDTQSDRISKSWNVIVFNINYRLMTDETPIAYGTEEVADVIRYCKAHAEEYHAAPGACASWAIRRAPIMRRRPSLRSRRRISTWRRRCCAMLISGTP